MHCLPIYGNFNKNSLTHYTDKKGETLAIGSFLRQVPFDSEHFETQSIKKPFGENNVNPGLARANCRKVSVI